MTVISEFTRQEILRYIKIDPYKVRVVTNCVSADFLPVSKEYNSAKPVFLQIGTGSNKNVERVTQALRGISCQLRVIGKLDEGQLSVLRQCQIDYSSVSMISDLQVIDEYRQCDFLVFASTYEGFGLPIIEAQATGRPVVTSTLCSMPEVAGGAACLVDPYDVASIRAGIVKLINNAAYRDELIRRGFENVKRFQAHQVANEYSKIYRELMKEQR